MLPTYGTPLRRLIHEPNDLALEGRARDMILDSIRRWEPRVAVQQVTVTATPDPKDVDQESGEDVDHVLSVKILFVDPENIQEVQELVLEVPLAS